jgi:iron complex outermembrane receptor protein
MTVDSGGFMMTRIRSSSAYRLLLALTLLSTAAMAVSAPRAFNIQQQSLAGALSEFARQGDQQILFSTEVVDDKRSAGVAGEMEPETALRRLLQGTGLTFRVTTGNTILVDRVQASLGGSGAVLPESAAPIRLAQLATPGGAPGRASDSAAATQQLEEVVVTGTRLGQSGLNAPTPVMVLGANAILDQSPANVEDVLSRVPAFRPSYGTAGADRQAVTQFGVQGLPDLRGLGITRTLVLVDGQRFVGGNYHGLPDTNMLPTSLIDHIDVVTGGASAAYGSDAVAGVVNVVLKDRMQGIVGHAQIGQAVDYGDDRTTVVSIAGGSNFLADRLHAIFGFDYARSNGVGNMYSRPFTQEQGLVPTGTQNAWLNNVEVANATPGSLITSAGAGLQGLAFDASGNPYQFPFGTRYNGNSLMVGSSANYGNNPQPAFLLANPYERSTVQGKLTYDITPTTEAWVQANYGRTWTYATGSRTFYTGVVIRNDNPYLPTAIRNQMALDGLTTISIGRSTQDFSDHNAGNTNRTYRVAAGIKGKLFDDWGWDGYFEHGRTKEDYYFQSKYDARFRAAVFAVRDAGGNIVCGPIASNPNLSAGTIAQLAYGAATPCVPFNPFGTAQAQQAAIDYVTGRSVAGITMTQDAAALNLRGSPFADWAGPVAVAVGGEYRRDKLDATSDLLGANSVYIAGNQAPYAGKNTVSEGYIEAGVPLLKGQGAFLRSVDFNAAARYTSYQIEGSVHTWKVGLTYDVNDDLRFRTTKSRDIRAPSLYELYGINPRTTAFVSNPFNGTSGQVSTDSSGNPNLAPEFADTFTAGVVFEPKGNWAEGFRASVDRFDIKVKGVILVVGAQDTITGCYSGNTSYCSLIDYGTSNATGIDYVHSRTQNLSAMQSTGFDLLLDYDFPNQLPFGMPGRLGVHLLATYTSTLSLTTPAGCTTCVATTVNYAGSGGQVPGVAGSGVGGVPKWSGNLTFNYKLDRFSTAFQLIGFTSMLYDPTLIGPEDSRYATAAASVKISQNQFPGLIYANWTLRYDLINQDQKHLQLYTVINNVANRDPPSFSTLAFSQKTNLYDSVGRTVAAGIAFGF